MQLEEKLSLFDPNLPLESARTIPSLWYQDADIYRLEQRSVFARSWLAVCRKDQLMKVGQYVQIRVAGERILVLHSPSGELKAFYDVCRHKAASVVSKPCGSLSRLRCRYHGWTYDLDGKLIGTPEFRGVKDFDPSNMGLEPVAVAEWGPLVFVNLSNPEQSLDSYLSPIVGRQSEMGLDSLEHYSTHTYDLECNWKVFIDNYLDGGYHINTVHPDLASVIDYAEYTVENKGFTSLQTTPLGQSNDPMADELRGGTAAYYWWVYPNLMINSYEGILDTNLVVPTGTNTCRVQFDYFFAPSKRHLAKKSIEVAHRVQLEDEGVCREVQEGLESRSYSTGRFSVKRESGAYYFHKLLAQELKRSCSN